MMRASARHTARGFTLVELVVAMTLSAIVIGFATMFMRAPVDAYIDQSERAVLSDSAQMISRSLDADLRAALPNSVRIRTSGSRAILEMITVSSVGFYQRTNALSPTGAPAQELDVGAPEQNFSVYGRLNPAIVAPGTYQIDGSLIMGNRGVTGRDAYRRTGVVTTSGTLQVNRNSQGEEAVQLPAAFTFAGYEARNRIFVFKEVVSYICNTATNARTLRRYSGYALTAAIPTSESSAQLQASGVVSTVLANNISSCRLRCRTGSGSTVAATAAVCHDTLEADYWVTRFTTGNETLRVFEQYAMDNTL